MVPRAGPGDPMTTRWAFGLIGMGIVVGLGYVRLARPWDLTWGGRRCRGERVHVWRRAHTGAQHVCHPSHHDPGAA